MSRPDRPNLEYLKKLAKETLEELRRADPAARLARAQLAVARAHGFSSWRKLRSHLDDARPAGGVSADASGPDAAVQAFFDAIERGDEAALGEMLDTAPELANARHPEGSTALLA